MPYSAEKYIAGLGTVFYFRPEHIDSKGGLDEIVPGLTNDIVELDYTKHVHASNGYSADKYIPHLGKLTFVHPRDVINKPARTLTADSTGNTAASVIEITFSDDGHFGSQITEITRGGTTIAKTSYTVSAGKISFIANTFPAGTHTVVVKATGYADSTVSQTTT